MDNETLKRYYYKSIVVDFDQCSINVKFANPETPAYNTVGMNIPYNLNYLQYYTKPNKVSDTILSPLRKVKIDLPIQDSLDISDLYNTRFLFYTKDVDNYDNITFSTEKDVDFEFDIPDSEKLYILNKILDAAYVKSLDNDYLELDIPRIRGISESYIVKDKEEEMKYLDPYIIIPYSTHIEIHSKRDYCHEDIKGSREFDRFLELIKYIADQFIQTQPQIQDDEKYSHIAINAENPNDIRIYYCMSTNKYIDRIIDVSKITKGISMDLLYNLILSRKTMLRFISRNKELLDMMRSSI